jgi:hypothetical protein
MSSLIYITRIQSPSAELAQALESSGVHVKSFAPGEITADECVLVMTSEAVLAGLRRPGAESRGMPPLEAIQKHLGADAALWNRIKAGEKTESAAVESKPTAERRSPVPAIVPSPDSLGFVASQAGARALEASQLDGGLASRPFGREGPLVLQPLRTRADERPPKSLWQSAALVAVLSVFALMLLTGHDPILPATDIAAVENRKPGERSDPGAAEAVHKAFNVRSSTRPSNPAAEARQHISDYDFVAEDYTTHFDQHSHPAATTQAPDPRRATQNRLVRKRVVID